MSKARDMAEILSTPPAIYSTDAEVAATYLTLASASTTYQTKTSSGLTLLTPGSITNTGGTASIGANGTVTFSAVASQSINDVFSSAYQNYRIVLNSDFGGSSDLRFRLRVGGTDASGSDYTYNVFFGNSAGTTGVDLSSTGTTSTSLGYQSTTLRGNWIIDIYSPFEAKATVYNALSSRTDQFCVIFGGHSLATSYTGFTFIPSTSMTGQVSVYAYNK